MGWTGDAQVFAKTAAYNMYIKPFMDKWLTDLRDAQLMYCLLYTSNHRLHKISGGEQDAERNGIHNDIEPVEGVDRVSLKVV